jgi:hypothetical protein
MFPDFVCEVSQPLLVEWREFFTLWPDATGHTNPVVPID